jgi:hypothetical protein
MAETRINRDMLFGPLSNVTTVSCIVNDRIMLLRPNYKGIKFKYDATPGADPKSSVHPSYYRYGFRILFPEIGKFIGDSGDSNNVNESLDSRSHVIYLHEKSGEQVIEFITTELGTFSFYVVIKGITVHDHASIVMGGPAYATYFTEPAQEPEE